jgi:TRAP transporter TAXI family solute receptor
MPGKIGAWWCGPGVAAVVALALVSGLAAPRVPGAQEARFFRIGAAATSGSFFEIGGIIASAISKPLGSPPCGHSGNCGVEGLLAITQATQGSVENLRMIGAGQIESGIAQSDIVSWAYAGKGIFAADGPIRDLRAIASLFPESLQLVVRADSPIRTLADLKGKHVSLGQPGSGTLADARVVVAAAGLGGNDLSVEYRRSGAAAAEIRGGSLDGFFLIGGTPVPAIRELAASTPIRLIPIDDGELARMKESSSSYHRSVIPGRTYPGVEAETPTIGFNALWIVSANAPDDLIYEITKSLWNEATERLLEAHDPLGKRVRLENALEGVPVPLHPGAKRFYREIGISEDGNGLLGKSE